MASHDGTKAVTLVAAANTTIGTCIEINSSGLASVANATTDVIVGIAGETVSAGDSIPVVLLQGIVEVTAGAGGLTAGNLCTPDASGTVTAVASLAAIPADSMCVGVAVDTAAAGDTFRMLAQPLAAPHTA